MNTKNNTAALAQPIKKAASKTVNYQCLPAGETSTTWLTPPEIIEALAPFDLDPATPEAGMGGRRTATRMLKPSDDGLTTPWPKNEFVFHNPPYGKGMDKWMAKAADHGNGITLIFARTETRYFFDSVWRHENLTAFFQFDGRLQFLNADGETVGTAAAGSLLIAYGQKAKDRILKAVKDGKIFGRMFIVDEAQKEVWQLGRRPPKHKTQGILSNGPDVKVSHRKKTVSHPLEKHAVNHK